MVNTTLFRHIAQALDNYALIKSDSGLKGSKLYVYELALLIPDGSQYNTKYSLVISAKWLDSYSRSEALNEILPHLRKELLDETYIKINRVVLISSDDPFIENAKLASSTAFTSTNSILEINNIYLGEYEIERAYIIKLNNHIKENA